MMGDFFHFLGQPECLNEGEVEQYYADQKSDVTGQPAEDGNAKPAKPLLPNTPQ